MERADELHRQPVHVLRHRFSASDKLIETISPLFAPEVPREYLSVYGSKKVTLPRQAFYDDKVLSGEIAGHHEVFVAHTAPIFLGGQVSLETSGQRGWLELHPRRHDQEGVNSLLEEVKALPDLNRQSIDAHFFVIPFPVKALIENLWHRQAATRHISKSLTDPNIGKLHWVRALDLANAGYDSYLSTDPSARQSGPDLKSVS